MRERRSATRFSIWAVAMRGLSPNVAANPPPGPPPPPPVTGIDLTEFAEIVNNARTDDERALTTPLVATSADTYPDLAYRGSTMVFDKDHLAWWERTTGRETMANLGKNNRVAVWVRNPV